MKYKKYIVFQSDRYYPAGGLADITGSFDTLDEAHTHMAANPKEDNEIVDRDTWEVVECEYNCVPAFLHH